jgi:membrane fusion protein YbhG
MHGMLAKILLFLLVIGALVGGVLARQQQDGPPVVSGLIESEEVRLGSRVGGRVATVLVEEGQAVRAGDVLVTLEPFDLHERVAQARAELAAHRASLARLEAGLRPEEVAQVEAQRDEAQARLAELRAGPRQQQVEAAREQVTLAEAELTLALQEKQRVARLLESGTVPADQLDIAVAKWSVAGARVASSREELALLVDGTRPEQIAQGEAALRRADAALALAHAGFRQEEIDQARAQADAALAQVASLERALAELAVRAPMDGVVEALGLRPGDLVAPNAPILSLRDPERLWLRAYVPVGLLPRVYEGAELEVRVDGFSAPLTGKVSFVARQAEFTPGTVQTPDERSNQVFRFKVQLDGSDELRPGMTGDVVLRDGGSTAGER